MPAPRASLWLYAYCGAVALWCAARGLWWPAGAHLLVAVTVRWNPWQSLRDWDALLLVPLLFALNARLVPCLHPREFDRELAAFDELIGGGSLLEALTTVETPWLVTAMKLAWMSYYLVPLLVAIPLWRRDRRAFLRMKDALVIAYVLTYLLYLLVPAVGPAAAGFAEPQWSGIAGAARELVAGLSAPEPRQSFPSGHVSTAVVVGWLLARHRLGWCTRVGVPLCAAILGSTLYLRYHYLVDVLAGVAVAAAALMLAPDGDDAQPPPGPGS